MDSPPHNEERRQTRSALVQEFEFYFQFIRSLVLDLPEEDDKSIAAAWVHKLRPETLDNEEMDNIRLRLDYLKLLLFVLQRRHLVGIFRRLPPEGPLEPFPHNFNISDMGNMLLEQDDLQSLGGGDAYATPYAIEISNDLKEFVAAQEIPNFGVQVYYAMSTEDPIHKWSLFDERRFPKFIREKIEQLKIMKSAGNMDLLKSKQSLLTEQNQSLKDIQEIANLNKCTSKVKSPLEIENSQERVYQAYINYDGSRPPDFNDKCNGTEKSWRKTRTTKKTCPDGSKVEVTRVEEGGPSMEPSMAVRTPVKVARSSTVHQVEVKGDDVKAVEAAAQKELDNLMKEHSSKGKDSGPCECPGHNQRPPSRRCGSERTSRQRTDNNFSTPGNSKKSVSSDVKYPNTAQPWKYIFIADRKDCQNFSVDTLHQSSSVAPKSRSPCRSPCAQRSTNFTEEIFLPSPNPQRQRNPCMHAKKHSPNCGAQVRTCCNCPKKDASPPPHCNCKSLSRDRNGARPEPEKYSQRSPCNNRPRTCGSSMRYEQSDNNGRHRDFNNQAPRYERSDCDQGGGNRSDRERERRARLRRIAELESKQRNKRCPPPPTPDSRTGAGASGSSRVKTGDPCPCPCNREPAEQGSSPCIGGAGGRMDRRGSGGRMDRRGSGGRVERRGSGGRVERRGSGGRVQNPCYEDAPRGGRNGSPSRTVTSSRCPPCPPCPPCPQKSTGYKETEVKSICNKTTRYNNNCPDKGNKQSPVVNKTCIVEKSEKIIEPCQGNESSRTGSPSPKKRPFNYSREKFDDDHLLDHCRDDLELPPYETSIPVTPDRFRYMDDSYPRRTGSPMRYTSTPKRCNGNRTPEFPGDISRIRTPDDCREFPMKSPQDPDISGITCNSSGESDSDCPEFLDELTGLSPDTPSPGHKIESMGIRDFLHEGLTEDISGITEDEYVDMTNMSPDDTFSSPEVAARTPPSRKICPSNCPGVRPPERQRVYQSPPPPRPQIRPGYETPARRPRHRVDSNVPLPLPRRPDYTPAQRMVDDSQTSDSDGYEFNPRRNLLSELEKASDRPGRGQPVRTESESVWERAHDEMRSCGCDDDTSDAERYNRRSRYD